MKDFKSRIEENNLSARTQRRDVERMNTAGRVEEESSYAEVMKELKFVKQDLRRLKMDMKSVMEEKILAGKDGESSKVKTLNLMTKAEVIRMEIDETNEEQMVVELAKFEAVKEFESIEQQRKLEIKQTKSTEELENHLACKMADVNMSQNQLMLLKELDNVAKESSSISLQQDEEEQKRLLESGNNELDEAKRELTLIKEESFQFMVSMDVIRNELRHVREETARLRKAEVKADMIIKNLNSKLLRAKSKLEAVTAAEEKAKSIASNLTLTLEKLASEVLTAKKENELISEETKSLQTEIDQTEFDIDSNEEKLQVASQELELVKSSEAEALEKLRMLTEEIMKTRASAAQIGSPITISNSEYEYLTGHPSGAEEIADKKVAAAQAWVEALKAGEKEILMRSEFVQREIRELRLEEENDGLKADKSQFEKPVVEEELQSWRTNSGKHSESEMQLTVAMPRKSFKEIGSVASIKRPIRVRKGISSPAPRHSKPGYFFGKNKK